MDIKLRNMTSIYISKGDKMLLLYRQGGRVVSDVWVGSAGGHFEEYELNNPKACVLRELKEELGLLEEHLKDMRLRYVALRRTNGEIRQNYYFFAELNDAVDAELEKMLSSNEGRLKWFDKSEVKSLEMPITAKYVIEHYLDVGSKDDKLYGVITTLDGGQFCELEEF